MQPQFTLTTDYLGEGLQTKRRSVFLESAIPKARTAPPAAVYAALKPLHLVMRIFGVFPVAFTNNRVPRLSIPWLAYSAVLFLLLVGYVGYIQWDTVEIIGAQEGSFEGIVIGYLFNVYLLPGVLVPLMWLEGRKVAGVMGDWGRFEAFYLTVTKRKLDVYMGNRPVSMSLILPLLGFGTMVVTHITMAKFRVIQVVPYCHIASSLYLVSGLWFMQCDVVAKSALQLATDFQKALKHPSGPISRVSDYRSLWMLLSKMVRDVADSMGYTLTFLCLYLFLVITLTIYGLLSQIQSGFGTKDIGLTINAGLATAVLYFVCDEAHYASNSVRVQFQKKLLLVELAWMNDDVQQEISMFLKATEMSPTDMSVVGFFDVNRNLFKSLLATMVTYLVVLLQFQISIPEDNSSADHNATVTTPAP